MGGALAIWASVLEVDQVMGLNNSAQGGSGANAAGDPQTFIIMDPPPAPPMLGRGGDNGAGFGGFLATHAAVAEVEDSTLAMNRAVGGRLVGRVHHLVGPENGGVWWLGEPDVVVPFVAGGGGLLPTMAGASGGSGGTGGGGAVYGGAGRLEIRGSALAINEALGGNGGMGAPGSGGSTGQRRGGDGGRGGDAAGAAVCLSAGMTFRIETTLMQGNLTMAGRGGAGGRGGDATGKDRVSSSGGNGGFGGQGGNAFGGALYSPVSVVDAAADARISGTYAAWNKVVAGDGFYGGNGGMGAGNEGGFGAIGGHGGQAKGGALHVMSLHLERSTLDRNLVSGGWGGASGHGSAGNRWGGWGSVGGSGGVARGGGLSILAGAGAGAGVRVDRSTVSGNRVVSGFGGQGGAGGTGNLGGGGGGWGGLNGEAAGGGVHNDAGANALVVVDSTIAWNRLDTGDGGHAGLRGFHAGGFSYLTVPTRYQAGMPAMVVLNGLLQPGPAIRHGAASELVDATGYQLGTPSPGPDGVPYVQAGTIGDPGFQLLANPADMTDEQKAEAFAGAFASGGATSAVALAAGVGWVALKAYLVGSTLFSGPTAVTTGLSLGVAGFGFSGIAAGGAVLSIGVVVGVKFLAAGISSGDWEGAAAFALGSPGDVTRFNLGVLLTGVGPRASDQLDDEIVPQPGSAGVAGGYVPPTGPGIQGGATLARSLVSTNTAERRVRPPGAQKLVNNVLVVEYTEQRLAVSGLPEISGTAISQGGNLIGAASGFPVQAGDQVGTPGAPLDARVDVEVGDHGGGVPTLKLLPGSPARGAVLQAGGAGTAQNGYIWPAGTMRDIGAWGALPNRPPVVTSRNHRIIQGSGDRVNIHGQDLLDAQTDPDGDTTLGFSLAETVPGDGEWLVWGLAGAPLGILSHQFTPDPGFLGYKELFRFRVTDGELESGTGVLTLQTVAPPDPESCPLPGSGTVVLINDQPSTAAVAARVELPDESRADHGFTGPFTVEFWMNLFRPGGVWAHEHEALITKGDGSWRVQRAGNTSRLAFDITGLTPLSLHSAREIGAGWHHVAAVFDGTRKYLFIDGELDAWADISGVPAVNDEPVWIGANSERLARTFQGAFDEVRIWNRARTPAEIRAYATRSLTGHEPGLLTYYRFDEPAGEVVLNLGMTGTAEPGRAIRQDPDRAPERYSFGISRAATPVLWEYGTTVLGRHLFYNDSVHDGRTPGADPGDDGAIALGKSALLPGGVATAMNVSSYSKGLNGVMIDVARLRFPGAITAADFVFTRGSAGALDTWEAALPPAEVVVRPGEGVCGSSRVTLVWDARGSGTGHEAVGQGWLGVRMLANSRTGLLHDEVFHFGSAIGESDDPDAITSAQDALRTLQGVTVSAGIDHALDHNRDGLVSAADALVVLNHVWTGFHRLDLRTPSWVTALPLWNPVSPSSLMGGAVATAGVHDVAELPPFVVSVERPAVGRLRLGAWIPPGRTVRAFAAGGLAGPWEEVAGIEVVPGEDGVSVVELPVPDGQSAGFYRLE
jgi:hypothetical protein